MNRGIAVIPHVQGCCSEELGAHIAENVQIPRTADPVGTGVLSSRNDGIFVFRPSVVFGIHNIAGPDDLALRLNLINTTRGPVTGNWGKIKFSISGEIDHVDFALEVGPAVIQIVWLVGNRLIVCCITERYPAAARHADRGVIGFRIVGRQIRRGCVGIIPAAADVEARSIEKHEIPVSSNIATAYGCYEFIQHIPSILF